MTLPYPPPFQDLKTLAAHISMSERTIEEWVKLGLLPAPRLVRGKRLWRWRDVEKALAPDAAASASSDEAATIREATRAAAQKH